MFMYRLLLSLRMSRTLADTPGDYSFMASNFYVKNKMYWKITIVGAEEEDEDWAAIRVLDGLNSLDIKDGQLVAIKGKSIK